MLLRRALEQRYPESSNLGTYVMVGGTVFSGTSRSSPLRLNPSVQSCPYRLASEVERAFLGPAGGVPSEHRVSQVWTSSWLLSPVDQAEVPALRSLLYQHAEGLPPERNTASLRTVSLLLKLLDSKRNQRCSSRSRFLTDTRTPTVDLCRAFIRHPPDLAKTQGSPHSGVDCLGF